MKERPIIFSSEMVRAILEGRKTQTRRVIKPQPVLLPDWGEMEYKGEVYSLLPRRFCPYGREGDRLWVKEAWRVGRVDRNTIWYRDDSFMALAESADDLAGRKLGDQWKSARFMFRWASRITLEVSGVRVERVQDIWIEDAVAEGLEVVQRGGYRAFKGAERLHSMPTDAFASVWDSINARRGYAWESNPWVWVVEFKKID